MRIEDRRYLSLYAETARHITSMRKSIGWAHGKHTAKCAVAWWVVNSQPRLMDATIDAWLDAVGC